MPVTTDWRRRIVLCSAALDLANEYRGRHAQSGQKYRRYSDRRLIKHLKKLAEQYDRCPTMKEVNAANGPSTSAYIDRWGSYSEACRAANLKPRYQGQSMRWAA